MVKIQVDLTDDQDKVLEIFKARNRIETKEIALKKMIETFTECKHEFETLIRVRYSTDTGFLQEKKNGRHERIVERCKICGFVRENDIDLLGGINSSSRNR